jgi:hypothetical protein
MKRFSKQYDLLGLEAPSSEMQPREKAEIIFYAACKKLGIDPSVLPAVHDLPERFRVFPVASYQLEVITEALLNGKVKDYNNNRQAKWGAWFYMNKPGFRFLVASCGRVVTAVTGGPRLSLLSEGDAEFFAEECIALWADFCGGQLPVNS